MRPAPKEALQLAQNYPDVMLDNFIHLNRIALADVLDTVITGDRLAFNAGYEHAADKEAFRADWENANRTSMNRIEQSARAIAKAMREKKLS